MKVTDKHNKLKNLLKTLKKEKERTATNKDQRKAQQFEVVQESRHLEAKYEPSKRRKVDGFQKTLSQTRHSCNITSRNKLIDN